MSKAESTKEMIRFLTTSTVGTVLPQYIENYGSDKQIDLQFSFSHDLFLNGFPDSKVSGAFIDKNGNFKIQINLVAQVKVETEPKKWENVRNIYITAGIKF